MHDDNDDEMVLHWNHKVNDHDHVVGDHNFDNDDDDKDDDDDNHDDDDDDDEMCVGRLAAES